MKGLAALLKKELKEQWHTKRIIIVVGAFLFFGFTMPLMTKCMPEILEMAEADGSSFNLPPPTAVQSLGSYASNIMQIGSLVIILVTMGAVAKERESGTAALVLTKPVGHSAFVAAKFLALSLTATLSILLGGLACCGYTFILFGSTPACGFFLQNTLLLVYLLLAIAVTLSFSSFFRSQLAAGALGLVTIVILGLASSLPWVGEYLPGELISWGHRLISDGPADHAVMAIATTLVLIVLSLYLAWTILKKKEI